MSSKMGLFTPAIKVLQRMAIPRKFSVILLIFLIPLVYLSYNAVIEKKRDIQFFQMQQQGLRALQPVTEALIHLNTIRDEGYAKAHGYVPNSPDTRDSIEKLENAFKQIDSYAEGMALDQLKRAREQLQIAQTSKLEPLQQNIIYSQTAMALRELRLRMAEQYGLTLGRDGMRYQLSRIVVNQLSATTDLISSMRGIGTGIIQRGHFTPDSYIRLSSLADELDGKLSVLHYAYKAALTDSPAIQAELQHVQAVIEAARRFLDLTHSRVLEPDTILIPPSDYFQQGTRAIDDLDRLYMSTHQALYQLQSMRIEESRWSMFEVIGISLIITLLVVYLFTGFYLSMKQGIEVINHTLERIAQGYLGERASLDSRDEVNAIAQNLNHMAERIATLVSNMAGASQQLVGSAEEMAAVTDQTLSGIRQQNSEIDMVSTAVNELSATVSEVARNAAEASDAAQVADKEAANGQRVVSSAIGAIRSLANEVQGAAEVIQRLEQESDNIGTVVKVIRDIAEQTNLLALNAAIEAARAGDQGRGFAVVADEVRTLAVRTQDSTEEIRSLIEGLQDSARQAAEVMLGGREQADRSVAEAAEAGDALRAITDAVSNIRDLNAQIATAAEQQSNVTEEVNRNLVSIRDISTQTAQGADKTAAAGTRLQRLSSEMQVSVDQFSLSSS
ncbi:MAG: methyl-accepting chemotaxis protein [Gammaproteobacteria bacterium]|nr:methyl-accepting chemotaxis protein [Gammaproteobacteria bacterium]